MKTKSDIWIKVFSLGIGMAIAIVLIAKVFFELSYDSFYKDVERIYTIRRGAGCGDCHTHYLCVQRRHVSG